MQGISNKCCLLTLFSFEKVDFENHQTSIYCTKFLCMQLNKISCAVGYIHTNGGSSTKAGGGGGLIGIVYTQGYVAAEMTAYGGSGGLDNAAAGVIYIKNSEFIKKVTYHLY